MRWEWDESKRLENVRKHGIDFIHVAAMFDGPVVTIEDDRPGYDEVRFISFGLMSGRVVAVVHTERGDAMRIISVRKATRYEELNYLSYFN